MLSLRCLWLLLWMGCQSHPNTKTNFLVIDIDTLRMDRVGAQHEGQAVTPHIDALAQSGVRFTQAIAQAGWTLPALTAMMTGSQPLPIPNPRKATVRRPNMPDLPDIFRMYGYHTAVFWGATLPGLVSSFISEGFSQVDKEAKAPTQAVLDFLDDPPEPFFMWVHQVDLQSPEALPVTGDAWGAPTDPSATDYQNLYRALRLHMSEEETRKQMVTRYDSMLHAYDAEIGQILDRLSSRHLDQNTVVIFTSDHGEDFFEHSIFEHGILYDTILRVPLIIRDPQIQPGRSIDTMVQGMDLAPTLLERAGIPIDGRMVAQSLLPLLQGRSGYQERPAFSMSKNCHASLRTPSQKIILRDRTPRPDHTWVEAGNGVVVRVNELGLFTQPPCASELEVVVEVYDLQNDPLETSNIVLNVRDQLGPALQSLLTLARQQEVLMQGGPSVPMTPPQVEAMRRQGYWGLVGGDNGQ